MNIQIVEDFIKGFKEAEKPVNDAVENAIGYQAHNYACGYRDAYNIVASELEKLLISLKAGKP